MLEMIGYVIWSSIRSGLRPGQSVKTITCTSERSGMASSGLVRSDHTPKAVAKKTRKRTMNRLWALYSMTRLIISYATSVADPDDDLLANWRLPGPVDLNDQAPRASHGECRGALVEAVAE